MFNKNQILTAFAKVKSGSDFPTLVQELKSIGVQNFDHIVKTGTDIFYGDNGFSLQINFPQPPIEISIHTSIEKLKTALKLHQSGETDYLTFCIQAGASGVNLWTCDLNSMTVIYEDLLRNIMVSENIPQI